MPFKEDQARCVIVSYTCDSCGKGDMLPHGKVMLMCDPPKIPHKCTKCDYQKDFNEKMPMVKFMKWDQLTEPKENKVFITKKEGIKHNEKDSTGCSE